MLSALGTAYFIYLGERLKAISGVNQSSYRSFCLLYLGVE